MKAIRALSWSSFGPCHFRGSMPAVSETTLQSGTTNTFIPKDVKYSLSFSAAVLLPDCSPPERQILKICTDFCVPPPVVLSDLFLHFGLQSGKRTAAEK